MNGDYISSELITRPVKTEHSVNFKEASLVGLKLESKRTKEQLPGCSKNKFLIPLVSKKVIVLKQEIIES